MNQEAKLNGLGILQDIARQERSGKVINAKNVHTGNADRLLPSRMLKTIYNGGSLVVDYTGNLFLVGKSIEQKQQEKKPRTI